MDSASKPVFGKAAPAVQAPVRSRPSASHSHACPAVPGFNSVEDVPMTLTRVTSIDSGMMVAEPDGDLWNEIH